VLAANTPPHASARPNGPEAWRCRKPTMDPIGSDTM